MLDKIKKNLESIKNIPLTDLKDFNKFKTDVGLDKLKVYEAHTNVVSSIKK